MIAKPAKPRCPFCHNKIESPEETMEGKKLEFPVGGRKNCGSVYALDITGHNTGAAALAALVFASHGDESLAYSLSYGTDYEDAVLSRVHYISRSYTNIYSSFFV